MAEEKPVHEQVQDLLESWNKPAESTRLDRLIGENPPPGDTRATAAVNPAFTDDGDVEKVYGDDLDDLDKSALQAQAEARGLAKSGNMAEIRERIDEHDESDDDDE